MVSALVYQQVTLIKMIEMYSHSGSGTTAQGPNPDTGDQLVLMDRIRVTYSNLSSQSAEVFYRKRLITLSRRS